MNISILEYLSYDFVRYALYVGVLISLCSALFGVVLVLKRFSFIGDGLSHVAFGAMAIAAVANVTDNTLIVLPVTVVAAILLLHSTHKTKMHGDSAIALLSVSALALGYMLMSIFSTSANVSGDVCSTLFGSFSILTLTRTDLVVCCVLSVAVIALFVIFYNRIFCVTFDKDFSQAAGIRTEAYNLLIATVIAVIITVAMNLVGSLLVSALIIFPALSAMRICRSFRGVVICAATLAVVCSAAGIILSMLFNTPTGPSIVAIDIASFGVCCVAGLIKK